MLYVSWYERPKARGHNSPEAAVDHSHSLTFRTMAWGLHNVAHGLLCGPRFYLGMASSISYGLQQCVIPYGLVRVDGMYQVPWHMPRPTACAMCCTLWPTPSPMAYAVPYGLRHALWR